MRGVAMRAAAVCLCAVAACATAPTPAGRTDTRSAGPTPPSRPATPPPAPLAPPAPPATPAELAERIVTAQGKTDGTVLANVFFAVQDDLQPGDDRRVENALRVIEEIAARIARIRAPKQPLDDQQSGADHLDPLVNRIDELVWRVLEKGSCTVEPAAARAAAQIDRVPRTRRGPQTPGGGSGRPMSKRALVCAMSAIKGLIAECYARYQIPGMAMVNVVIDKQGAVRTASTTGKFAGTPTGACVDAAVKTATFPPSDGFTTPYPFQLK